jgi:hypothetical protein
MVAGDRSGVIDGINWLAIGGGLSLVAAVLHLGCIVGGPDWYRFFGAGEGMARMAEQGDWRPALITLCVAAALAVAGAYALSGAGLIARLPFLRTALVVISAVYLLRGLVLFMPSALQRPDLTMTFLVWSSTIVLAIGLVHAIGTWRAWHTL